MNLNTARLEEIADLPELSRRGAEEWVRHRPFRSWEDVRNVPGLPPSALELMLRGNVVLTEDVVEST